MTENEKAKAYDEALKKASAAHKDEDRHLKATLERIFPELKEDDDERIKKDLIQWVDEFPDIIWRGHYKEDIIAWLEKQGDKLIQELGEYKVKYTQEVLEKYITSMSNKDNERLRKITIAFLKDFAEQGYENAVECIDWLEKQGEMHLWTIQDAKDGDVIFYDEGWTCIFKCIHGIWYSSYCFITDDGEFHTGYERHAVDSTIHGNAHPATKEQRDLLFQKIKEAGYEWDADKKELKKLVEPKFKVGDWVIFITSGSIYQVEKKENYEYTLRHILGSSLCLPFSNEKLIREWNIQDAKDGDVLYSLDSNQPFIYKKRNYYEQVTAYCGLNMYGKFFVWDTKDCAITLNNYVPATKEQRDALMKAMNNFGCQFQNFKNNKEIKLWQEKK